jgi:hypothetical protein
MFQSVAEKRLQQPLTLSSAVFIPNNVSCKEAKRGKYCMQTATPRNQRTTCHNRALICNNYSRSDQLVHKPIDAVLYDTAVALVT